MKSLTEVNVISSHLRFFNLKKKNDTKTSMKESKMIGLAFLSNSIDEIMKMCGTFFFLIQIRWEVVSNLFNFSRLIMKFRLFITSQRI